MTNYNKTCIQIRNNIISKQKKPKKQDKHHVGINTIIFAKSHLKLFARSINKIVSKQQKLDK
jgi:hypothetical protein